MDPEANLKMQDEVFATAVRENEILDIETLNELREELLSWIRRGGFSPAWANYPRAARDFSDWVQRTGNTLEYTVRRIMREVSEACK